MVMKTKEWELSNLSRINGRKDGRVRVIKLK
jgi:hypothetical protein